MRKYVKEGQVGLMLLVVIGLVVGLILSIASRSLSDTAMSRQGKESNTTFSVAENGIETALRLLAEGVVPGSTDISDSTGLITGNYEVNTSSFELFVDEGETAQVDLTGQNGDVTVSWVLKNQNEDPGTCTEGSGSAPASLEIAIFSAGNVVSRSYYNSDTCDLSGNNGFSSAAPGNNGYLSEMVISVSGKSFMRLKPIYHGATLKITGSAAVLGSQLYLIQSVAEGGDAQKEIEVKRSLETPGSVFDYVLFSGGVITK